VKIFVLPPGEDWVIDRFAEEWSAHNADITTKDPEEADLIWLLGPWYWDRLPLDLLERKRVVTTIHHLVPWKFDDDARAEFAARDRVTDLYHGVCDGTAEFVAGLTERPVFAQITWINGDLFRPPADPSVAAQSALRRELGLAERAFTIGSFQRDTEGHDLASPKLEKGPDVFCDFVEQERERRGGAVQVLLGGWRRQYVTDRLERAGIPFAYHERPDISTIARMYHALDLYVVSARCEGGPQAIGECASSGTPLISTDVGVARRLLAPHSIAQECSAEALGRAVPDPRESRRRIEPYLMPDGFSAFRFHFEALARRGRP
jgi:glycosyltransferase involved in cell wall biosynthesis